MTLFLDFAVVLAALLDMGIAFWIGYDLGKKREQRKWRIDS